jgi:hypothetical protein
MSSLPAIVVRSADIPAMAPAVRAVFELDRLMQEAFDESAADAERRG